jgi:acylphosphatase
MKAYKFNITGRVQGVFYRKSIQQMAALGHLKGYIKNLQNGSVEVVVDLYEDQIDEFRQLLQNGSPMSEVVDIIYTVLEEDDLLYDGFEIRYD